MRTRVKICGFTRPKDAMIAAQLGADAIGLVFYPQSPRAVDIDQAQKIIRGLSPFVSIVALFVDAQRQQVEQVLSSIPADLLQFHGSEDDGFCAQFNRPFIKAIAVQQQTNVEKTMALYPSANGFLFDSYHKELPGGSGSCFDWELLADSISKPYVLAGGLEPNNVVAAIARLHPYAVDVSSGVESSPGIKDEQKIRAFIQAVNNVGINLS